MTARERILGRLRSGPADPAGPADAVPPARDAEVFTDWPADREALLALFTARLEALRGEVHAVADEDAAAGRLVELLRSAEEGAWLAQRHPLVEAVLARRPELDAVAVGGPELLGAPSPELASRAAGISACDALVARTGSVVLDSRSAGGRRLSVLPPLHVVLARANQLVPSLEEALRRLGDGGDWSYAAVITGPSRTADIEKILVLGAHGPRRLAVVVIGEA